MSERYTWEIRETKLGEAQVVVDNTKEDCWYGAAMSICEILNCKEERIKELEEENEQLRQQQQRLYNYFKDYLEDEMSAENFGEMWDNVKEDESWEDE